MKLPLVPAVLTIFTGISVFAQAPELPSFEVATMKLAPARSGLDQYARSSGGPGSNNPTHVTLSNYPLRRLLREALHVKDFQIEGPGWIDTVLYDIEANVPPGTTREQYNEMLLRFVTERLKLKTHREQKDFPTYSLVIAEKGFKLKPAASATGPLPGIIKVQSQPGAGLRAIANAAEIDALRALLEGQFQESFVLNQTGLSGKYTFTLEFAPIGGMLASNLQKKDATDLNDLAFPSIFTALQEQLGLRLEKGKAPHDVFIVDSGGKTPLEN